LTEVFDGHNDALGALQKDGDPPEGFLSGLADRDIDLPRARAGGLAGGLFAIHAPSPAREPADDDASVFEARYAEPVDHDEASVFTLGAVGRAHALAAASAGAVAIVRSVGELDRARSDGALAMALHLEGAEAIGADLAALDAWHAAGVRSIGPVWSRGNAFGHGVPFRFPSSSDTGPGLTAAGSRLVARCAASRSTSATSTPPGSPMSRGSTPLPSSRRTRPVTPCARRAATSPTISCARSRGPAGSWGSSPRRSSAPTDATTPTFRSRS
jgi:membrane dipeptidase